MMYLIPLNLPLCNNWKDIKQDLRKNLIKAVNKRHNSAHNLTFAPAWYHAEVPRKHVTPQSFTNPQDS